MNKVVFLVIFMIDFMYASSTSVQYDVGFSVVGTIAKASMHKVQEDDNYVITMQARTVGFVAELTKEREDTYISQGSVVGSVFVPDVLVVKRETDDKEKYTIYTFDHNKKTIQKETSQIKQVRSQSLDISEMRIIYSEKEEFSVSSSKNDYYAKDDIVSLLFNSHYYISSMDAGERKKFHAVGINTEQGELLISLPTASPVEDKTLIPASKAFDIVLKKDFFKNGQGILAVSLDEDGFLSQATMNNVALYGDVVGKRVYTQLVSK